MPGGAALTRPTVLLCARISAGWRFAYPAYGFVGPCKRSAAGQKAHYFLRESLNATNRNTTQTGSRIAEVRMPSMVHISTRIIARKAIQI